MLRFAIIDAPSVLGLRPTGIEGLPEALKKAGLLKQLKAEYIGAVQSRIPYSSERDQRTMLLNAKAIREYSQSLANVVSNVIAKKKFPIVLGGDCSVLIGPLLALRRKGRYGLFFIDGHSDFYQPQASHTGEVADMELAIVSGRGPDILTNIDNLRPLVRDTDVVVFGYRDSKQAAIDRSQNVKDTEMHVFDLLTVKELNIHSAASMAIERLLSDQLDGFWIHLDVDVLEDSIMPAVDYRQSDGIGFSDLSQLLRILLASKNVVGLTITIFNPRLDFGGSIARKLVSSIVNGLL
ncbi:MAG: arginase family protein [Thermoproteota archaeon]|nr:arginase family protein [Thermoproteota archaeon]